MASTLEWANVNAPLVYHKYKTNSTSAAITYSEAGSLFIINEPGDCSISANLACMNGNGSERAIIYFTLRVYAGSARHIMYAESVLENAYYSDKEDIYYTFYMGGSIRLYVSLALVDLGTSWKFVGIGLDVRATLGPFVPNKLPSPLGIEIPCISLVPLSTFTAPTDKGGYDLCVRATTNKIQILH